MMSFIGKFTMPLSCALVLILFLLLLPGTNGNQKLFCPPKSYALDANRTASSYKTAIITEVFGRLHPNKTLAAPHFATFLNGHLLSRHIYNHIGVFGIDKIYLAALYDVEVFPNTPPTIADVYPPEQYCVVDWFNLGVVGWRPVPYGGPRNTWLLDKHKKPTIDRDYYKTLKGFNPIYEEIRNHTDWIFVIDSDEYLFPVNFNATAAPLDWCGTQYPTLITRILSQMLTIASEKKLDSYETMIKNETLDSLSRCTFGSSYYYFKPYCMAISAFTLPVYVWLQSPIEYRTPLVRSKYTSAYVEQLNDGNTISQTESWKSVYQTRYNPPLVGRSLHHNPSGGHSVLAPRSYHGGLSLEIAHARLIPNKRNETIDAPRLMRDNRWVELHSSYEKCAKRWRKPQK